MKVAVYYYPEATVTLTLVSGQLILTDETGDSPYCRPLRQRGQIDTSAPVGVSVPSYDQVGLFYGFSMPGIGWS